MTKIVNIISDTNIGGAGKILLSFLELSSKPDFEHLVIVPDDSLLIPELDKIRIKYIAVEGIADKSLSFSSIRTFVKLFKRVKPDIVHTHASLSARIAARIYGKCKIVHTRHSVFDQPESRKRFPLKQISGSINNFLSDMIIAVSPAAKENLVETGTDSKKIAVIFNGVNTVQPVNEDEKITILNKYDLDNTDFICAIIARLEYVKGHKYVLEAARLLKEYKNIKFIIAGTGSIEKEIKSLAESLGLDNCIFTGFVKEIHEIENIMRIQLNSSYGTEATSLSLLEGMSLGIPAVVSDFGGNPYVITNGENGFVIPKKNSKQLAASILKLYNNKELYADISYRSKEIFKEKFTSEIMAKEIENVYKSLI